MKNLLFIAIVVVLFGAGHRLSAQSGVDVAVVANYLSYHGDNHLGDAATSSNRGLGLNVRSGYRSFLIDFGVNYNFTNISESPIFVSGARSTMRDASFGVGYRFVLSRLWEADITYHVAVSRLRSTIDMHGTAHGPKVRFNFVARKPLRPMVFIEVGYWIGTFDALRAPEGFRRYFRQFRASLVSLGIGYRFGTETFASSTVE